MAKRKKYNDDFTDFWKSVEHWRAEIQNNSSAPISKHKGLNIQRATEGGPGNESLNRLENAWQQCKEFNEWPGIKNRDAAKVVGRSPLSALFGYIDIGLYPPPELLLAALQCFDRYMDAEGSLSLEEAFFGKEVQGIGKFSSRQAQRQRDLGIAVEMAIYNRDGLSDEKAAEMISLDFERKGVQLGVDRIKEIANTEAPRVSRGK